MNKSDLGQSMALSELLFMLTSLHTGNRETTSLENNVNEYPGVRYPALTDPNLMKNMRNMEKAVNRMWYHCTPEDNKGG